MLRWRHGFRLLPRDVRELLSGIHQALLCLGCVLYGAWRAGANHPLHRKGYLNWLRTTPWHAGMKLPLGPVTLTWWDVPVLVAAVALAHWHSHQPMYQPLLAFACGYVTFALLSLAATAHWEAYSIALGAAFVARYWLTPILATSITALLFLISQLGLRRSLSAFPWDAAPKDLSHSGYPGRDLRECKPMVRSRSALLSCILLGTWVWAVLDLEHIHGTLADLLTTSLVTAFVVAISRLLVYCALYHPPITLVGRLTSGRLIVGGYDYVLLAPAAAIVVAPALVFALARVGAPASLSVALTVAVCLYLVLALPPTVRYWQLTGSHRAVGMAAGERLTLG